MDARHRLTLLFSLIAALLLAACGQPPALLPIPPNGTIVAFGDSLTQGVGVQPDDSYPAELARLSGRRVINAGVSGETTAQGRARLPGVLDRHQPKLLILLEGGNDILRNIPAADIRANLDAMIRQARDRGIQVVLVGVPEKNPFSGVAPWYPEIAVQHGLAFEEDTLGSLLKTPSMKSDAIHLNREGYRRLAVALHELLQQQGAL